jgi:cytochrome P450 / NADPH-cytochrome P450 reductase
MLGSLEIAQARARELPIQSHLHFKRDRELQANQQMMAQTVQRIIQDRRSSGTAFNDLLDRMLTSVDRESGEKLDDINILAQCVTFLVAGHETTSGLLSFALYALLKNPDVLARACEEVDRVLGTDLSVLPTYAQTHQVPYVSQILEETLRLWPNFATTSSKPSRRSPSNPKTSTSESNCGPGARRPRRWQRLGLRPRPNPPQRRPPL